MGIRQLKWLAFVGIDGPSEIAHEGRDMIERIETGARSSKIVKHNGEILLSHLNRLTKLHDSINSG